MGSLNAPLFNLKMEKIMLVNIDVYVPKDIKDVIFNSATEKQTVMDIVSGKMPFPFAGKNGILLYGLWGTGKTTLAQLLPDAIERAKGGTDSGYTLIKCIQGTNGSIMMNKIINQAEFVSMTYSGYHYFVIDEVDNLTEAAMASLKSAMNMPNTIFIITTNHIDKVERGVINRCEEIEFNAAPAEDWLPLANRVLKDMKIKGVSDEVLVEVIDTCKGSARDILTSVVKVGLKRSRTSQKMNVIY
jgi:DNA polymerase III delta prime subunit